MLIATLIAAEPLNDKQWKELEQIASAALPVPVAIEVIDREYARDLLIEANVTEAQSLRKLLETRLETVDIIVQPAGQRQKKLLISDMDSTMISAECIDELADYAGIKAHIAEVTEKAMRGELDFEAALRERVALLKGLDLSAIATCLEERIRPMPGAKTLIATCKSKGMRTVLVSGGFLHFAEPVGQIIGFDHVCANALDVADDKLTGGLAGKIVDAKAKSALLEREAAALGIGAEHTLALGDGANDIPMLRAAGLGIAYHAKPAASDAADAGIRVGDLTATLYALGIPRSAWAVI